MEQIRRIMRPTDVPDTGLLSFVSVVVGLKGQNLKLVDGRAHLFVSTPMVYDRSVIKQSHHSFKTKDQLEETCVIVMLVRLLVIDGV